MSKSDEEKSSGMREKKTMVERVLSESRAGGWVGLFGVPWGRRATEELGEERPEGGGPGREIWWDGAPGCRTSQ